MPSGRTRFSNRSSEPSKERHVPQFEPVLLANIGKPDSHTRAVYEAGGGYQALRKVLAELSRRR